MTVPLPQSVIRGPNLAAGSARPVDPPLLDQTHNNQLCVAIGSARFDGLLDLLAKELIERPATIRRAVLDGDVTLARHESHSLKGATTSIGAMALGAAAAAIEQASDLPNDDRRARHSRPAGSANSARNRDIAARKPARS